MALYTSVIGYNSCSFCNSTGNHPKKKDKDCPKCLGDHEGQFVCQVEADNLDTAVGKILYEMIGTLHYEDNPYDTDDPALIDGTKNCWFMMLLDANERTYLVHIIKTDPGV